ncbi:peptidyl-Lys metalloendopeptidase [Rhizoctonia solani AG-1 IB]|uniref:Peptidyl-Lys metalloendopeptidase n=1 Tax=Thanatephorus cucumeris (strain AG1-IB / isolate 7/3/14) TaxID=1108050 RepID=A0A0B7FPR2_THACB|nr:peptidyl-Lys metalloendopeptidase [Rhizoctonia solani AG-1 IB]
MNAPVVALLFSLLAAKVSGSPSLVLDIDAPSSVVDVDGLTVKATLKNTGDVTLKLLNDPRSVLSKVNTNTFSISSASGTPKFTGLRVKYVPSQAAKSSEGSAFTTLAPGQTIEVDHNLAGSYNFTRCGEGSYNFSTLNLFNYVDESGELKTIEASTSSHQFKIAGKLAASNRHSAASTINKRAVTFTGCSADQQSQLKTAATASDAMVANANSYLSGLISGKPRYTTWFGAFDKSRYNTVASHFKNIGADATSMNYDCTDCLTHPSMDYPNTYAYVDPGVPSKIYLCGAFWRAPTTGTDSKAGTIVHENSHFTANGAVEDHVYGQGDAQALAKSNPAQAIMNADSHEYFAENTPELS